MRASSARSSARTAGELVEVPLGSVTTGRSGALLPPVPWKSRTICWFVTQPSFPGTENFCLSALVAEPAEAMPISVSRTQKTTTMRLCARTQRVSGAIPILLSTPRPSGPAHPERTTPETGCRVETHR